MNLLTAYRRFYTELLTRAALRASGASTSNFRPWSGATMPVALPQYNAQQYLLANEQVSWVYAAVDRISDAVGEAKWRLYRKPKRRGDEREEITEHPALDLLRKPNPFETGYELFELTQDYIDLAGEGFWVFVRNGARGITEVWTVNPTQMEVIPSREDFIAGYLYMNGAERLPLATDDVLHFKRTNPRNRYRGLSPIAPILSDVESHQYASLWNRNFFRNSAQPGGIIEVDRELSDEAFAHLQQQWSDDHRGVAQSHRVAILEAGMKWQDRKLTQRDMQFKDLRKETRDVILANFGLPQHVLGISEHINRANAEAGEYVFSRWVVRPRLVRMRDKLNSQFLPKFDLKDELELDFDEPVPENKEFTLNRAERGWTSGLLSRDEARAELDLDPDEGPDVYFVPNTGTLTPVKPGASPASTSTPQPAPSAQDQPGSATTNDSTPPGENDAETGLPAGAAISSPTSKGYVSAPPAPVTHTGAMVAFYLNPMVAKFLAVPGGEPPEEMHITLCFLGDAKDLSPAQQGALLGQVTAIARATPVLTGSTSGLNRFPATINSDGKDVLYAAVDVLGLMDLQAKLAHALVQAGVPYRNSFEYTPHITLQYIPAGSPAPFTFVPKVELRLTTLTIALDGQHIEVPLSQAPVENQMVGRGLR